MLVIIAILLAIVVLVVIVLVYMRHPKFGKAPTGLRLDRIKKSPNFRDGQFQNINFTPDLAEGYSMAGVLLRFLQSAPRRSPIDPIPSIKTDLIHLPKTVDVLIWFGHSSYLIQVDGKRILVDPVLSGNASPIPGTTRSFAGTDIYAPGDFPEIDCLLISHDHYDHVDYETLIALRPKVNTVICPLGVGAHFEHWGYAADKIIECDWHEEIKWNGLIVYTTPARHFSGRSFTRKNTLWQSYVLQTSSLKIYIGGDSGYDTHYAAIGAQYGPFDLVILDNGQYDLAWHYIHNLPEEVLQAAKDLKAKRLFPVHSSKFVLGNHPWDEPLARISERNKSIGIPMMTPMIGEVVNLHDANPPTKSWWVGIK